MKLLIRGGSIAAGYGVNRSYVDILKHTFPEIDITNSSRIKDNSFQGIWNFHDQIEVYQPDVLLLHFGMDDAYNPVYRSEFKENLVQIVRLARKRFNPDIILLTSHPFEDQYEMEMISMYYRVIREVAMDLSCDIIPIHAYWLAAIADAGTSIADYLQQDCRYPNELGHDLYARAVIQKLKSKYQ